MHVCACIQGQIMHDVREEPLDIPHRGPQDRVRYIQVASRAQSALFLPTNAQATVHCLFYTTSPSYWAAPQKSMNNGIVFLPSRSRFGLDRDSVSKKWSKKLQSRIPISVIQLNPRCNTNSNNKLKCHCKTGFQHMYIFTLSWWNSMLCL